MLLSEEERKEMLIDFKEMRCYEDHLGCSLCDKIEVLIAAPRPRVSLKISEHSYLFGVVGHNYAVDHVHGRIIEKILRSIGVEVVEEE